MSLRCKATWHSIAEACSSWFRPETPTSNKFSTEDGSTRHGSKGLRRIEVNEFVAHHIRPGPRVRVAGICLPRALVGELRKAREVAVRSDQRAYAMRETDGDDACVVHHGALHLRSHQETRE